MARNTTTEPTETAADTAPPSLPQPPAEHAPQPPPHTPPPARYAGNDVIH